ncbi:hypothetical protein ACTG25_25920 [Aeromonas sp. 80P]
MRQIKEKAGPDGGYGCVPAMAGWSAVSGLRSKMAGPLTMPHSKQVKRSNEQETSH